MTPEIVAADLTWTGERFEPGIRVEVTAAGRIGRVGRLEDRPTRRLTGHALLPGMVNGHSHAFQRGLRGRGERFPEGAGTFWSWRDAMYALARSLDRERLRGLCLQAFAEMRDAGITTVGEFHYLHHATDAADYALDEIVLDAARTADIRIVLLNAYYRTGGIGQPLSPAQRRFGSDAPAAYWRQMDALDGRLDRATQSLGAVVHSIRAASPDELGAIHTEAARRRLPFHIHVAEQRQEVEECLAAYGAPPMALINHRLTDRSNVTAVHCTHARRPDLAAFLAAGGRVCLCPLTEANLGDGIPDLSPPEAVRDGIALGTDCNTRISMLEEMRWLEYGQRLKHQARGALADERGRVAAVLLRAATETGARALGVEAGAIAPDRWADFVALDLSARSLAGADADTLPDALVFGAGEEVIAATCVGGRWREQQGRGG